MTFNKTLSIIFGKRLDRMSGVDGPIFITKGISHGR